MVAAVLGRELARASVDDVVSSLFGFTLVNDWRARAANGDPVETAEGRAIWNPLSGAMLPVVNS